MKNRLLCLTLAFGCIMSLCACGKSAGAIDKNGDNSTTNVSADKEKNYVTSVNADAVQLWISPDGDDNSDGTEKKPLATIEEALERTRSTEYSEAYVYLTSGRYYLNETIELTSDDHDIHFCSVGEEAAELLGSYPVTGWKQETINGIEMWVTQIDEEQGDFSSLFSESVSLPQSRWPKEGYFSVSNVSDTDGYGTTDPNLKMQYAMYVGEDILSSGLNPSNVSNVTDVTLRIIHWWKDETVKIKNVDLNTGRIEFSRPATMTIKSGDRYYFENVFETMSQPGEWYLDKSANKLFYIPMDGDDIDSTQLYAGNLEQFVVSKGADNISFNGISFSMGDWSIPVNTFYDCGADHHQAAYDVTPAFSFTNTENVSFDSCKFNNINSTCLKFGYDVHGISVTNNEFRNIGANAVFIVGENLEVDNKRVTKDFLIHNNLIESYGRRFYNATAIGVLHGANGEISNNEIHDGYSTAITLGWVWGYGYSVTSNILVEQNLIYDIGQNILSDMGAIYTLGVKDGIEITENVVHDVQANMEYGYGGWGIYMDEGSSNVIVSKNLVYDCSSTSFYQHYGQDNIVMNNIFAFSEQGQVSLAKAQPHIGFHLIKNIIVSDGTPFITGMKGKNLFTDDYNFYWDYSSGDQGIVVEKYNEEYGLYNMATFVDPKFTNPEERDFVLRDFSSVIEDGFVKWDISKAGISK